METTTHLTARVFMLAGIGSDIGFGILAVVIVFLVILVLANTVKVVQQGYYGVVKRLGQFHSIAQPGILFLIPFVDRMVRVDVREEPRTGDRQDVITRDNVSVMVSATIFSQVVDPRAALFEVSDYRVAIEQLARTALRAVFGGLTLDEALSERQRINTELQNHMDPATEKWGVRINRIEIVDIAPPAQILQAMNLQKEAEQKKRALILQSEGQKQAAINEAEGRKQAAILAAEGQKQAIVLDADGRKEALRREAEGRASAIEAVYSAIQGQRPTKEVLAILQLDTLGKLIASNNAKVVVPVETAGLLGAAEALRSVLAPQGGPDSNGTGASSRDANSRTTNGQDPFNQVAGVLGGDGQGSPLGDEGLGQAGPLGGDGQNDPGSQGRPPAS
jgi:regulator of protease activity HflC (stomatin/prohibitin superfamily)